MSYAADETIEKSGTGWWGRVECEDRCQMAIERFPLFFGDPAHEAKVEQVLSIVKNFFKVSKGLYVNRRVGTSKSGPFTAVKIDNPVFPNSLKNKEKIDLYYEPLKQLGVKIVFNRASNSYLYHVR